ncbi:fumarylacetoacetate hydrolase family protein [Pusillimonas sp. ANT_WB101]|uniref:fumarylacetoacetate hydrolase family protein n=1 Tax=Pusillimonas sp. ANT_WB101 TaxID=2597356 RepID=UPI00165DA179|nr:fumarylacetoacetate hydrolase family protein [Pusillimonas sp. ANT_WB101]
MPQKNTRGEHTVRLVTFEQAGKAKVGCLLTGDRVLDLADAYKLTKNHDRDSFSSMLALIEDGESALEAAQGLIDNPPAEALLALSEVRLLAPIPRPPRLRSMSSYPAHLQRAQEGRARLEARSEVDPEAAFELAKTKFVKRPPKGYYQTPIYWLMDHYCVSGPEDEIVWPAYSEWIDYELELVAVIGKGGSDIKKEQAEQHIFGYTLLNDLSARDEQALASATSLSITAKGKDFHGAYPMGPCIVTRDEIDIYALDASLRVNGVEWASASTANPQWTFADCIAYASRAATLIPGEMISSATVANCSGLEQARKGSIGDIVELHVAPIGVLRNKIVAA